MKPSPKSKTSSQPSRRASRQHRPSLALLLSLAAIAILGLYPPRAHAALSRGPNSPYRHNAERTAPRTLVIAVPGASWSDLRQADMPNLHQLMAHGASALMPVAKPSDADPNRTWATLSAGRPAAGAPSLGAVRVTPEVGVWTDNTAVQPQGQHRRARWPPGTSPSNPGHQGPGALRAVPAAVPRAHHTGRPGRLGCPACPAF